VTWLVAANLSTMARMPFAIKSLVDIAAAAAAASPPPLLEGTKDMGSSPPSPLPWSLSSWSWAVAANFFSSCTDVRESMYVMGTRVSWSESGSTRFVSLRHEGR
jgi:hypothetical protein